MSANRWKCIWAGVCLLLVFLVCVMLPFASSCDAIREKVFRLHVLASSDSQEDQCLKLAVRDAVLKEAESVFSDASGKEEAMLLAKEEMPRFLAAAKAVLAENGVEEDVRVEVCRLYFPKRVYEDGTTLPAGQYDALRVVIGAGEGANWWCLLFPKLCLSAAAKEENATALSEVLTPTETDIVTQPQNYQLRFFLYDALSSFFARFFAEENS